MMNVTQNEMDKINKVQFEMFKEFVDVCKKLNLKYYVVHGSLLGALRYKGFFPFDDDIDIAMPRKDYDIFLESGQELLSKNIFVQCNKREPEYPMVFAKLRNNETAFIQPVLDKCDINKGIYIDIFPIDNYPSSKLSEIITLIREKFLSISISGKLSVENRSNLKKAIIGIVSFINRDWNKSMKKLDNLYSNNKDSEYCIVHGGKQREKKILWSLFGNGSHLKFEGMDVSVPEKYEEYLTIIYGDWKNYNPAEKYMKSDNTVEVSASIIDLKNSYKKYK